MNINAKLTAIQQQEVNDLLLEFDGVLSDIPGRTSVIKHRINLVQEEVVRSRPYKIPFSLRSQVNQEIEDMLKLKIIEPSNSPYVTPIVVVKKPDSSNRICLNFRRLNQITVFDSEPMTDPDQIFANIRGSKYFSKLDLSKGYWQVPLEEESKQYTAFPTDKGLFQFTVLAFGLVNAPATFNKLMCSVLQGMAGVHHFLEDILIASETWIEHLQILREVLNRLKNTGLTARPSKCHIGMFSLDYLGHTTSGETILPMADKVKKIENAPIPTTKKELRSFLGLSGYYRKFIPHYATIAAPLTDLIKKNQPNRLEWSEQHHSAFQRLKKLISTEPVLVLPNLQQEFVLRTDASNSGLGAILLQEYEGRMWPVAYAKRKLLQREKNYSVIEKECLALVWGVQKFSVYLYGRPFKLETDHKPLAYLQTSKNLNGRLMRWALILQPYVMHIQVIKGSVNVGADYLSSLGE